MGNCSSSGLRWLSPALPNTWSSDVALSQPWVGGMAPLGYDTKERRITVNDPEAETVRTIFRNYLQLGSLNLLMADLRKLNPDAFQVLEQEHLITVNEPPKFGGISYGRWNR